MLRSRGFLSVTAADFLARSAYQVGKTPVLPLFAASLGAEDVLLGLIVSVSTLTGAALKPFIGALSDRTGRRLWLLLGTAIFAGMPLVYGWVDSPQQLVIVRVVHGLATAVYGPVTLAYVVELSLKGRAERLGWFSMARNAGYVIGPAAGGFLLLFLDPVQVFTVVGLVSLLAFIPVALMPDAGSRRRGGGRWRLSALFEGMGESVRSNRVWTASGMCASVLIAEYSVKAFFPVYAVERGVGVPLVGAFFALQEGAHFLLAPLGGRIGDRFGHLPTAGAGMLTMGVGLVLLSLASETYALAAPAILIGVAQALVFPSAAASVSSAVREGNIGASMGFLGAMKNGAKVVGPAIAGVTILRFGPEAALAVFATALALASLAALIAWRSSQGRAKLLGAVPGEAATK